MEYQPWKARSLAVIVAVLACLVGGLRAMAAEVHIKPTIMVEQEYTDNFLRTEDDKQAVWVTQVAPGIEVQVLTDQSKLDFNYTFNYHWYYGSDDSFDASSYDYAGHNLNLYGATRLLSRLTAGLSEDFLQTREGAYLDEVSDIVNRSEYWRNRVAPFLTYDIAEKGEVTFSYRNEVLQYVDETIPRDNSTENRGMVVFTYHFNNRNHLDLDNQYWHRDYDGDLTSGYDAYQAMLIYRRELSSFLEAQVGAGYQWRGFEQSEMGDVSEPTFRVGLSGKTDLTKLNLFFERNVNDFAQTDGYYAAYRVNLYAERLLFQTLRPYLGGYYQFSNYINTPREDNLWNIYCGIGYLFLDKRLELSLEYNYLSRDSNVANEDFAENAVFLRLSAYHDFGGK